MVRKVLGILGWAVAEALAAFSLAMFIVAVVFAVGGERDWIPVAMLNAVLCPAAALLPFYARWVNNEIAGKH